MARRPVAKPKSRRVKAEVPADEVEQDENVSTEDDDADPEAEEEDSDVNAEDDDADPEAEDDDQPDPKAVREAERKRCQQLTALQGQADRMGVDFSASRAIARGMSVAAARREILNAAADAGEAEVSPVAARRSGKVAAGKGLSKEAKAAAWKKAIKG